MVWRWYKNIHILETFKEESSEADQGRRKRRCLEIGIPIQASMIKEEPQHQPLAHLDGAGDQQTHQPPNHQHEGDGGAAGAALLEKKRFLLRKKSDGIAMVDQHPHQIQLQLGFDGAVVKNNGMEKENIRPSSLLKGNFEFSNNFAISLPSVDLT